MDPRTEVGLRMLSIRGGDYEIDKHGNRRVGCIYKWFHDNGGFNSRYFNHEMVSCLFKELEISMRPMSFRDNAEFKSDRENKRPRDR